MISYSVMRVLTLARMATDNYLVKALAFELGNKALLSSADISSCKEWPFSSIITAELSLLCVLYADEFVIYNNSSSLYFLFIKSACFVITVGLYAILTEMLLLFEFLPDMSSLMFSSESSFKR